MAIWPAHHENIPEVLELVETNLQSSPMELVTPILIAVEEVVVNVVSYSQSDNMELTIDVTDTRITITVADWGNPYNPLEKPDPDLTGKAEDRQIGGLGIFMVKQIMDQVEYRWEDGKNVLIMGKGIK